MEGPGIIGPPANWKEERMLIAKVNLVLTKDLDKIVAEGDPEGAFPFAQAGEEIPEYAVQKYGIKEGKLASSKSSERAPARERAKSEADADGYEE